MVKSPKNTSLKKEINEMKKYLEKALKRMENDRNDKRKKSKEPKKNKVRFSFGKPSRLKSGSSQDSRDRKSLLRKPKKELKSDEGWVIFGKETCPFCVNAKNLLKEKGKKFVFYNVGDDKNKLELMYENLKKIGKYKDGDRVTIPQIFFNGKYIGGFTELEKCKLF